MPSAKVFFLLTVLGATLHCQVLARPQGRTGSTQGSIRVVGDEVELLPRTVISANYIEMKRTKLLRGQYSYTLGERITGDQLADQQEDSDDFPAARDVEAAVSYPSSSSALTLTYISILVEQSSEEGKAYIIQGGINQKFAEILIIANATTSYAHSAAFYGY